MPLIGYAIRRIRNVLEDRRGTSRAHAPGSTGPAAHTTPVGPADDTGARPYPVGDSAEGVPLGKEGYPPAPTQTPGPPDGFPAPAQEESLLDLPADPEHARTKKWSYWALVIVGFALAVDYSSTLMSIQPLYYLVNGRQSLYGLTFGSYDLASLIFAPVFGWWVDRTNRFKGATLLGVALNAVGNYIYGFTVLAGEWWLMLLARLVAGAGAAVLGIGGSYITRTSTLRKRQAKLGRYRITQNVARSVGPLIGFMFLGLPSPTFSSSDAIKVFNWYTIPGWLAGFIVTALCFFYIWGFTDPTAENEHFVQEEGVPFTTDAARRRNFQVFFGVWITLCGLVSMLSECGRGAAQACGQPGGAPGAVRGCQHRMSSSLLPCVPAFSLPRPSPCTQPWRSTPTCLASLRGSTIRSSSSLMSGGHSSPRAAAPSGPR
uniref:Major facilitator superfamily (MFS) profile domain-containing protein n=1 Tax=Auxenochlorella protothecoides TaxID=3075 RepID=A0A1D2A9D2_AUXPR